MAGCFRKFSFRLLKETNVLRTCPLSEYPTFHRRERDIISVYLRHYPCICSVIYASILFVYVCVQTPLRHASSPFLVLPELCTSVSRGLFMLTFNYSWRSALYSAHCNVFFCVCVLIFFCISLVAQKLALKLCDFQ